MNDVKIDDPWFELFGKRILITLSRKKYKKNRYSLRPKKNINLAF